ncbi:hypothetical protein VI817_001496 [Penicillium citrinum]|nr:hypothetical protein VI817_001496 [Penicillium citrinum]
MGKHRKVRCHFESDGKPSCKECISRGSTCRSQDLPEPENPRESDRSNLNERMTRVELLLEKVLQKLDGVNGAASPNQFTTLSTSEAATPADNAPVLSLFQNEIIGCRQSSPTVIHNTLPVKNGRDMDRLRHDLLVLMLPEKTIHKISEASSCWWLLRAQCFHVYEQSLLPIPYPQLSNSHPTLITMCLLWVAISLQQLPTDCPMGFLNLPCSPKQLIEQYMAAAGSLASLNEDMLSSLEGIECFILQAIIHNNDGRLRSAWTSYRHAMNIAQITGLHSPVPADREPGQVTSKASLIWGHIIHADRYLSLMLGMHHGIGDVAFDSRYFSDQKPSSGSMVALGRIAGSIIDRNQTFGEMTSGMVRMTQTIDATLGAIELPSIDLRIAHVSQHRTIERAKSYSELMTHLWFHQLTAWLHLPFLINPNIRDRYDYSRRSCLQASREMISCYTKIRDLTSGSFCCKSLDFQAFTAAVTLVLDMLGPGTIVSGSQSDWAAVESVMAVLRQQKDAEFPGKVATRGVAALETLMGIVKHNASEQSSPNVPVSLQQEGEGHIKIEIPYFGSFLLHRNARKHIDVAQSQTVADVSPRQSTLPTPVDNTNTIEESQPALLDLGPDLDLWTFDVDLSTLPPFLSDFGDNWDLGL